MHGLCTAELLRFARCNRLLLHAASHSFAWKYTQPRLSFLFTGRAPLSMMERAKCTLVQTLRRIRSHAASAGERDVLSAHPLQFVACRLLLVSHPCCLDTDGDFQALLARLNSGCESEESSSSSVRIESFSWRGYGRAPAPRSCQRVFSHPSMRDVVTLRLEFAGLTTATLQVIVTAMRPHLRELILLGELPHDCDLSSLTDLPTLTSLHVVRTVRR